MAAGLSVRPEAMPALALRFEAAVRERTTAEDFIPVVRVDCELPFRSIDGRCIEDLKLLDPTGPSNSRPVFVTRGVRVRERRVVGTSHLRLYLEHEGQGLAAIAFGMGKLPVEIGQSLDVLHTPLLSEWNGKRSVELRVHDLRPERQQSP